MPSKRSDQEPQKIVRLKLSEQVLDRLRDMISTGELKPGDQMPSERSLMAQFSVGRPAVREALQALHTQGLITISHGERSRVNEISAELVLDQSDKVARLLLDAAPANLEHLKQARRMFELGIARAAAEKATKDDIANLRALYDVQSTLLTGGADTKRFVEADMNFHRGIADILDNPVITAASTAMLRWLHASYTTLLYWSGKEEVTLREHAMIIDRIEANDVEGAARAMQAHLERPEDL